MKKVITFLLIMVGVAGVLWVAKGWTPRRNDPKAAKFNADAENLILGLLQYREFTGNYPTGPNVGTRAMYQMAGRTFAVIGPSFGCSPRSSHRAASMSRRNPRSAAMPASAFAQSTNTGSRRSCSIALIRSRQATSLPV